MKIELSQETRLSILLVTLSIIILELFMLHTTGFLGMARLALSLVLLYSFYKGFEWANWLIFIILLSLPLLSLYLVSQRDIASTLLLITTLYGLVGLVLFGPSILAKYVKNKPVATLVSAITILSVILVPELFILIPIAGQSLLTKIGVFTLVIIRFTLIIAFFYLLYKGYDWVKLLIGSILALGSLLYILLLIEGEGKGSLLSILGALHGLIGLAILSPYVIGYFLNRKKRSGLENRFILYLTKFKWVIQLETILSFFLYWVSLVFLGFILVWMVVLIANSYNINAFYGSIHPIILLALPLLLFGLLFGKRIYHHITHKVKWSGVAESYEHRKDFSGSVISSADFIETPYDHHKILEQEFIKKTYRQVTPISVFSLFQSESLIKPFLFLGILVFHFFIYSVTFTYTPMDTLKNAFITDPAGINYKVDYPKTLLFQENFNLSLETNAEKAVLVMKSEDQIYSYPLSKKATDDKVTIYPFHYQKPRVKLPFTFHLTLSRKGKQIKTPVYPVKILHRPRIQRIGVKLTFPKEYKLPVKVLKDDANLKGFYNTVVEIDLESNNTLKEAQIVFHKEDDFAESSYPPSLDMKVEGKKANIRFTILEAGKFEVVIYDSHGNQNPEQRIFDIIVQDSLPPYVEITEPTKNIELKDLVDQYIHGKAEDDYGVKKLILYYYRRSKESRKGKLKSITFKIKPGSVVQGKVLLPVSRMNLKPGDRVEYYAKGIDRGGQTGVSSTRQFIMPLVKQFFKEVVHEKDKELERIDQLLSEFKKFDREAKEALDTLKELKNRQRLNLKGYSEKDLEQKFKEKIKELAKAQEKLWEKIRESYRRLEDLESKINQYKHAPVNEFRDKITQTKRLLSDLLQQIDKKKEKTLPKQVKKIIKKAMKLKSLEKKLLRNKRNLSKKDFAKNLIQLNKLKKELDRQVRKALNDLKRLQSDPKRIPIHNKQLQAKIRKAKKHLEQLSSHHRKRKLNQLKRLIRNLEKKKTLPKSLSNVLKKLKRLKLLEEFLRQNTSQLSRKDFNKKQKEINQLKKKLKRSLEKALRKKRSKQSALDDAGEEKPRSTKAIEEKIKKINELLKDLLANRGKKDFDELRKLIGNINNSSYQSQWNEDQSIKRLEKVHETLKKLRELQSLLEAKNLVRDLKKQQTQLNRKIKKSANTQSLKDEAKQINRKSKKLVEKLKNPKGKTPLLGKKDFKDVQSQMNQAIKRLQKGLATQSRQDALKGGQKLQTQLSKIEKKLQQKIKQFQQRDQKELMAFLRNLLLELIELRKMEGNKSKKIYESGYIQNYRNEFPDQLRQLIEATQFSMYYMTNKQAQFDKKLEGAMKHENKAKFLKLFREITQHLAFSGQQISGNNFYLASQSQGKVLNKLNHLTLMLMKLKSKAKQQGSGSGGSPSSAGLTKLKQLFNFQQQINKEVRDLMGKMKKGGLSKAEQEALKELSKRQGQIGKEIDDLLSQKRGNGKDPLGKLLGKLADIKRAIDEIKYKLDHKKLDKRLLRKQKKVRNMLKHLSRRATRMKTVDSKGDPTDKDLKKDKKRRSQRPTMLLRERNLLEAKHRLRALLRSLKSRDIEKRKKLSPKQRKMVKEYFDSLEKYSKK